MQIIKGYQKNEKLRQSFNALAIETFNLSFEDWYQNGFWRENYIPYSIIVDERVIANVSVNTTDMMFAGNKKHLIQLGTVMTAKEYRNKGLIRQIMDEIENDYKEKVDGIYLFANDTVLDFYPKFGFERSLEYQYSLQITNSCNCQLEKIVMNNKDAWNQIIAVMNQNVFRGKFDMMGNNELIMFYVTKYMQECVYYHQESDTFIIAEIEAENAFIHNIFSSTLSDLDKIISLFGKEIKNVTFGFTPIDSEKYLVAELKEVDITFFLKGELIKFFDREKVRIPSLAHA